MRTRSVLSQNSNGPGVNVTPMIDVVMCLIVFYLMVGQLALDRRSTIVVSETETGIDQVEIEGSIEVGIFREGAVTINGDPIEVNRLEGEVTGMLARNPGARIRVRADEDADYGSVRPVLSMLQKAGAIGIEFVTTRSAGTTNAGGGG
ncbi:MAG: ExbD/TolR family protein [Phycisphaerales bacterium]